MPAGHLRELLDETLGGRYRMLRILGEGGMGAVFEAEHTGTGRRVAVKVIHPEMAAKAEMVARFQREARAAGSIETPHIVQVLDTGTDEGTGATYMVMEFLHGEDMQQLLSRLDKLGPEVALRLVAQACVGLGKAHAAGVVHRDIKPANLFLSVAEGGAVTVKVVDFGIAKIIVEPGSGEGAALTRTGGMLGSPVYMSPEQAVGKKDIDQRTDVWSLGVVLYQALSGQLPFSSDTLGGLIVSICHDRVRPLQDAAPWVAPEVADLVHRALSQDPAGRFAGVDEMGEAIGRIVPASATVNVADLVAVSAEEQARVAPRGAAPARKPGTTTSTSQPRSRAVAAVVLATAVAGGLGVVAFARRTAAVAPSSAPVKEAVATAASAAPEVAPAEQVVEVAVDPVDATVEVDGHPAPVHDGGVEIRGALASVHSLRLVKGQQTWSTDVAIAAQGAVPSRVRMEGQDGKPAVAPPRPVVTPRPKPSIPWEHHIDK